MAGIWDAPKSLTELVAETTAILRDGVEVLTDPAMRLAQARQMEKLMAILQERPADGSFRLRGDALVGFLSILVDCCARLSRAAEDQPRLARARAVLRERQDAVVVLRDRAVTQAIRRRGPSPRSDRRRNGQGP